MSLQSAQAFHAKVKEDPALQAQVRPVLVPKIDLNALAKIAKQSGFDATPQEIHQVLDKASGSDELSDFELEIVAAGSGVPSTAFV